MMFRIPSEKRKIILALCLYERIHIFGGDVFGTIRLERKIDRRRFRGFASLMFI